MPPIAYSRQATRLPLFYADPAATPGLPSGYQAAFLVTDGSAQIAPIPFYKAWGIPGAYLFLGSAPPDDAAFVTNVKALLEFGPYAKARFLWIANPGDAVATWNVTAVSVASDGSVPVAATLAWKNYTLAIPVGSSFKQPAANDSAIAIRPPSSNANGITLTVGSASFPLWTVGLSFNGLAAGCLTFTLTVNTADLDRLGVGCRYFMNDPATPGTVKSLAFPIFGPLTQALALGGSLDPVNALVPGRSFLGFPATPATAALASCLRNPLGQPVTLTPAALGLASDPPMLVFGVAPADNAGRTVSYYLAPAGGFVLGFASPAAHSDGALVDRLLCGFSGAEYLGVTSADSNVLHFVPGQPAYAPNIRRDPSNGSATGGSGTALTSVGTTSWIQVTPDPSISVPHMEHGVQVGTFSREHVHYFAQPEGAEFYQVTTATALPFFELPAAVDVGSCTFPMVPYAGVVASSLDDYVALEQQALSPQRRVALTTPPPATDPTQPVFANGVTPQGWELKVDGPTRTAWKTLTIANHGGDVLALSNVSGPLRDGLLSNQLFMVITDATLFKQYGAGPTADFKVTIDGWTFDLTPDKWLQQPDRPTIWIFKHHGQKLANLAANPTAWVWPKAAGDTTGTSQRILDIIARARASRAGASGQPHPLDHFLDTVCDDPSWNGIIVLNANAPLNAFPPELAGLGAGIDFSQFYAHHFGVNVTAIDTSTGIALGNSALFGMIHYEKPASLYYTGTAYDYQVGSLSVLFRNSAVAAFAGTIELLVNELFSERARQVPDTLGNTLVLQGTRQQVHGDASYVFLNTEDRRFLIDGHVLDEVEITRAQFVPGSVNGSQQTAQFALWGSLRFKELPGLDLFSFGRGDAGDSMLPFSGLTLDLVYDTAATPPKTITLDTAGVTFDASGSVARPDSIYSHFPLEVAALIQNQDTRSPKDLGYLEVVSPLVSTEMTGTWYGLAMRFEMGALGELTGGNLMATLLAAWAPGGDDYQVYVGLLLPGAHAADALLALQGVLKIGFRSLELSNPRDAAPPNAIRYVLKLRHFELSLFGASFPPGRTDLVLFGNPSSTDRSALGWYAAYLKDGT